MKLESNHGSSNGRYCFCVLTIFIKNFVIHFLCRKNDPERTSGSSRTYFFNLIYNIDPSTMVTRRLKICVSFADKYIYSFICFGKRDLFVYRDGSLTS